jgi:hypothetical protein
MNRNHECGILMQADETDACISEAVDGEIHIKAG